MIAALRNHTLSALGTPHTLAGLALVSMTALFVLAVGRLGPHPSLLQGWLIAFAIWSCAPIGSMTLLLVHRLTGGRWGLVAGRTLRSLAALMPLVTIAFVPILAGLTYIYPWAADPGLMKADVGRWYLSEPSFILRAGIALIGWSVLGLTFAVRAGGRLLAALGLVFFGFMISLVAVDWFLSVEPHYVSTAFAAMIAIQQLLTALAVAAVVGVPEFERKAVGDIGGLLIATLLGVVYFEYMTFVVAWYGDLPHKSEWYLRRSTDVWPIILVGTFVAGAMVPFAMLLFASVRASRAGLRIVGLLLLVGTLMHLNWLIMPAFAEQASVALWGLGALVPLTAASVLYGRGIASMGAFHAD